MSGGNSGGVINSVLNGRLRIEHASNRLIVQDANGVDKLLAGVDEDGQVRVKLAQNNIDVKTATANQLIFSSDFNLFKIINKVPLTISVNFPAHGGVGNSGFDSAAVTYTHNLGFIPTVQVFQNNTTRWYPIVSGSIFSVKHDGLAQQTVYWQVQITSTDISVSLFNRWYSTNAANVTDSYVGDYNLNLYITQETAS